MTKCPGSGAGAAPSDRKGDAPSVTAAPRGALPLPGRPALTAGWRGVDPRSAGGGTGAGTRRRAAHPRVTLPRKAGLRHPRRRRREPRRCGRCRRGHPVTLRWGRRLPPPAHACAVGPRAPRPLPPRRRRHCTQSPARGRAPAERRHGGARSQPPPARPPAPPPGAAGSAGNLTTNRRKQLTGGPAAAAAVRGARADHRPPPATRATPHPHARFPSGRALGRTRRRDPDTAPRPPAPGPAQEPAPKVATAPPGRRAAGGGAGPGEEVVAAAGRGCSVPALG